MQREKSVCVSKILRKNYSKLYGVFAREKKCRIVGIFLLLGKFWYLYFFTIKKMVNLHFFVIY